MSNIPSELKYTESHEWIRLEDDGTVTLGITDHAQNELGDLVYVELPDVDTELSEGDEFATVESVKAASAVYSPLNGKVIAVNEELPDAPEKVNDDAYGDGWMIRLELADADALNGLMNADGYQDSIADD